MSRIEVVNKEILKVSKIVNESIFYKHGCCITFQNKEGKSLYLDAKRTIIGQCGFEEGKFFYTSYLNRKLTRGGYSNTFIGEIVTIKEVKGFE